MYVYPFYKSLYALYELMDMIKIAIDVGYDARFIDCFSGGYHGAFY